MATIQYQPLDRSKREIRLIVLLDAGNPMSGSSTTNDPLKCDMITTSLDLYKEALRSYATHKANVFRNALAQTFLKTQPYSRGFYGLSYVWGDPAAVCDIEVDGKSVKIGASLHAALSSIRRNTDFRVIWADALCINQSDNVEKSWQVQQIAGLFSRAQATISWLGHPSRNSTLALECLSNLGKKTSRFFWSVQEAREGGPPPGSVKKNILHVVEDPRLWTAVVDLCSRPYWSRIWIFQEMVCAAKKYFLCGDTLVEDIDRPISLLLAWQVTGRELRGDTLGVQCLAMIDSVQTFRFHGNLPSDSPIYIRPGTLFDMLSKLSGLNATNQRDIIYAPLGIATDQDKLDLVPDYSKDPDTIFIETACALIRVGQLNVLLLASCLNTRRQVPSWVPDWSSLDFALSLALSLVSFRAGDGRSQRSEILRAVPRCSDKLVLEGYCVGRISAICNECPPSALETTEPSLVDRVTFSTWLREAETTLPPRMEQNGEGGYESAIADLLLPRSGPPRKRSLLADPYVQLYKRLQSATSLASLIVDLSSEAPRKQNPELMKAVKQVQETLAGGSKPYRMDSGQTGLTWKDVDNVGDLVVVIPGVSMPLVLRCFDLGNNSSVPQPRDCYKVVGVTFVPEIMVGGFFKKNRANDATTFTLI